MYKFIKKLRNWGGVLGVSVVVLGAMVYLTPLTQGAAEWYGGLYIEDLTYRKVGTTHMDFDAKVRVRAWSHEDNVDVTCKYTPSGGVQTNCSPAQQTLKGVQTWNGKLTDKFKPQTSPLIGQDKAVEFEAHHANPDYDTEPERKTIDPPDGDQLTLMTFGIGTKTYFGLLPNEVEVFLRGQYENDTNTNRTMSLQWRDHDSEGEPFWRTFRKGKGAKTAEKKSAGMATAFDTLECSKAEDVMEGGMMKKKFRLRVILSDSPTPQIFELWVDVTAYCPDPTGSPQP